MLLNILKLTIEFINNLLKTFLIGKLKFINRNLKINTVYSTRVIHIFFFQLLLH